MTLTIEDVNLHCSSTSLLFHCNVLCCKINNYTAWYVTCIGIDKNTCIMKIFKWFVLISLFFTIGEIDLSAQDLLVVDYDTLNCRIFKSNAKRIMFSYKNLNRISVPMERVQNFRFDYFGSSVTPPFKNQISSNLFGILPWRVAIQSGISYMIYGSGEFSEWGYHMGGDATYFGKGKDNRIGFGIKYDTYQKISDYRISSPFIGGNIVYRGDKLPGARYWFFMVGVGYMGFHGVQYGTQYYAWDETGIGFSVDLGCDFPITPKLYLGIQVSSIFGKSLTDYYEYEDNIEYVEMSRVNFSIGLRYLFWK